MAHRILRRRIAMPTFIAALACLAAAHAADGDLDLSFSGDGIATIAFAGGGVENVRIAADASGNILVGGTIGRDNGNNEDFAIARLKPDGTLDNGFGFFGLRTVGLDFVVDGSDRLHGIVPQADGKIMLLGVTEVPGEISAAAPPAVVRLTAAGNVDTSFGDNGHEVLYASSPWPSARFYTSSAIVQRDGKLLFAGYCVNCPDTYRAFALRVSANGAVDAAFGSGGWASVPLTVQPRFETMAVDRRGRIVLAGTFADGDAHHPLLVRLTSSGVADADFGDGSGEVKLTGLPHTLPGGWTARAIALESDGAMTLAVSNYTSIDVQRTALIRVNAGGMRDLGYAGSGLRNLTLEDGSRILALERRSDGRVVAAGWIDHTGTAGQDFLLARTLPNGDLDAAFDGNGLLRIPTAPDNTDGAEAMLLAAGKPVVAGYAYQSGRRNIAVVRLQSDLIFADGLE